MSDKGEATYTAARNPKFEQLRSDHETFLRTFESELGIMWTFLVMFGVWSGPERQLFVRNSLLLAVKLSRVLYLYTEPTQIYRFLRTRNIITVRLRPYFPRRS